MKNITTHKLLRYRAKLFSVLTGKKGTIEIHAITHQGVKS